MAKNPDDDGQLDGFDDEAPPAGGAPAPAPTRGGRPPVVPPEIMDPDFAPLRRRAEEADGEESKDNDPSKLRRGGKILFIVTAVAAMATGIVYGRHIRSFFGGDESGSETDIGPTEEVPQGQKVLRPFIGPLVSGDGPGRITINCGLNFTPPSQYTVACDGRFTGNPELRFDREAVGEYHNGTIYVNSGGKSYSCLVAISPLEGSRSEIHSAVFSGIGCMPEGQ